MIYSYKNWVHGRGDTSTKPTHKFTGSINSEKGAKIKIPMNKVVRLLENTNLYHHSYNNPSQVSNKAKYYPCTMNNFEGKLIRTNEKKGSHTHI